MPEKYLNTEEIMERLRLKDYQALVNMVKRGLPRYRKGRGYLYDPEEVDRWLKKTQTDSQSTPSG